MGLANPHSFVDGNKRTAVTIGTIFLKINENLLAAPEPDAVITFENLAAGQLDGIQPAKWFEEHCSKA